MNNCVKWLFFKFQQYLRQIRLNVSLVPFLYTLGPWYSWYMTPRTSDRTFWTLYIFCELCFRATWYFKVNLSIMSDREKCDVSPFGRIFDRNMHFILLKVYKILEYKKFGEQAKSSTLQHRFSCTCHRPNLKDAGTYVALGRGSFVKKSREISDWGGKGNWLRMHIGWRVSIFN